jgi:glucose-6-phosphate 1-dehydrogenase
VRYEKVKVLRAIRAIDPAEVVFGQYESGKSMAGYRDEEGVATDSQTDTFVAMKIDVDNWRWQGVPFYLRTGKRTGRKLTQIAISFRRPPVCMFESMGSCLLHRNDLFITLQPDEGFSLHLDVKRPGSPLGLKRVPLDFRYEDAFGKLPDAYETLLSDVLLGDQTLFVHADEVEGSWRLFDPLLQGEREIHPYPAGSDGPTAARNLLDRNGHRWLTSNADG